ncbi:ketopantoate reductase family protein [Syntrophomonas curvata]
MQEIRTVWVMGLGGVGGFFGGQIAYYLHQHDDSRRVYFIARGQHLREIREHGLILRSNNENLICHPAGAAEDPGDFPVPDLCLLAVKSYDLQRSVQQINPYIHDNAVVLPLLNGLDIYDRVCRTLDYGIVLPACIYIASHIEQPGRVVHNGPPGRILFGNDPRFPEFDPEVLLAFCREINLDVSRVDDPCPAIWEKYLMVAPFALVTAARGKSFGEVLEDAEDNGCTAAIMQEIIRIGQKQGIELDMGFVAKTLAAAGRFPYNARSSFQRDLEQGRGKAEGDVFGATISRMGREAGVATPMTDKMMRLIRERFKYSW